MVETGAGRAAGGAVTPWSKRRQSRSIMVKKRAQYRSNNWSNAGGIPRWTLRRHAGTLTITDQIMVKVPVKYWSNTGRRRPGSPSAHCAGGANARGYASGQTLVKRWFKRWSNAGQTSNAKQTLVERGSNAGQSWSNAGQTLSDIRDLAKLRLLI